ncbi:MAG: hypothetical protein WC959_10685 [Kiritimatiellales bacterium]
MKIRIIKRISAPPDKEFPLRRDNKYKQYREKILTALGSLNKGQHIEIDEEHITRDRLHSVARSVKDKRFLVVRLAQKKCWGVWRVS